MIKEPKYQPASSIIAVDLPESHPLTAEYFVDWLIEYKGLDESHRDNVISNLVRDYERVRFQGALEQLNKLPAPTINISLFGRKRG